MCTQNSEKVRLNESKQVMHTMFKSVFLLCTVFDEEESQTGEVEGEQAGVFS